MILVKGLGEAEDGRRGKNQVAGLYIHPADLRSLLHGGVMHALPQTLVLALEAQDVLRLGAIVGAGSRSAST